MNKNAILIFLGLLFLSGCATTNSTYAPTDEEIAKANYGEKPTQYKQKIEAYVKSSLFDPESAQFTNYSAPKKDWLSKFEGFGGVKYFGWLVCVDVNAKNHYGGYVGRERNFFIFQGNEITYAQTNGDIHKNISYGAWKYPIQCKGLQSLN